MSQKERQPPYDEGFLCQSCRVPREREEFSRGPIRAVLRLVLRSEQVILPEERRARSSVASLLREA